MNATFTCPKCGRHGSIKKEIPRGATVRCKGCQTVITADFGNEPAPDAGITESVIEQFLGPPSNPSPDLPVQDDEPMGATSRPQKTSPTREAIKPPESSKAASEPPKLTSKSSENSEKSSLLLILTIFVGVGVASFVYWLATSRNNKTVLLLDPDEAAYQQSSGASDAEMIRRAQLLKDLRGR